MKLPRILAVTVAGSALLAMATPLSAHGIWFAQRATQIALVYGVGADDLDAVKRLPLIKSVKGFDAEGQPVNASLRVAGAVPVLDSDEPVAIVAAEMDYGIWSKDAAGEWHNKGRDEVPGATVSEHNFKYALHLTQLPTRPVPLIDTLKLQLVPASTAIPQKMGESIKVRAFYDGKPKAGVEVMEDYVNDPDQVPVKTDAQGYATVKVRNQGLNVLMAIYVGPSDSPAKYASMEYRSSLSFVLPHKPE
jgi:nickel transport protein